MRVKTSVHQIFITGGTGYMGRHLIPGLLKRGHEVKALVRKGSEKKLPQNCPFALGDALEKESYAQHVPPADTFVQLLGVPSPNPTKANQFRAVDFASVQAAVHNAKEANIEHFVYVSVAHPAPVMKAYIKIRMECEEIICSSGMNVTILRPFYVLGPGHRWPYILLPMFWVFERLPLTRDTAQRLGLVPLKQMISALLWAIENPCRGIRILEAPQIRKSNFEDEDKDFSNPLQSETTKGIRYE